MHDETILTPLVDMIDALGDSLGSRRNGSNLHFLGIAENGPGEGHNLGRHGCGEKEGLALDRNNFQELLDVVYKAHVEHPIRLVEDEDLDVRKGYIPLTHKIQEASRSGDEDIYPLTEPLNLIPLLDPSEYDCLMKSCIPSVRPEALLYLDGELSCRCDDEGFYLSLAFTRVLFRVEQLDDRYRKGGSFPSTRLGTPKKIPSLKNKRDGGRLDRCRGGVSFVIYGTENRFYDGEVGKKHENILFTK